jgi:hypothetical protein
MVLSRRQGETQCALGLPLALGALGGSGAQQYAGHVSASLTMEDLLRNTGAHLRALTMPPFMDNILFQSQ